MSVLDQKASAEFGPSSGANWATIKYFNTVFCRTAPRGVEMARFFVRGPEWSCSLTTTVRSGKRYDESRERQG